jgi:AcrR family transcriptional regulator
MKHTDTTPRDSLAAVRRAQVIEEAIHLIGRAGFHGFTIQQLGRRCGLTNGGVLYHFPSKEDLLAEVIDEVTRRDSDAISDLIAQAITEQPSTSSRDDVATMLRVIVSHSSQHPELARLLAVLRAETIDTDHPAHRALREASRRALQRYHSLLTPICEDPLSMARRIDALMNGLTMQWLCEDQSFDLLTEWDRAMAAILPSPTPHAASPRNAKSHG